MVVSPLYLPLQHPSRKTDTRPCSWPRNDSSAYGQLCWSNSSLVQYLATAAANFLRADPTASILSISQNDNNNYCRSPEEMAIIEAEGSPMGPLLRAINIIAATLAPEFPLVAVDTLAYQHTQQPPRITKPAANVVIRLCDSSSNMGVPMSHPSNAAFVAKIKDWGKLTKRLHLWN